MSYGSTTYTNNLLGLSSQTTGTSKTYYMREPSGAVVAQRRYSGTTLVDTDYFVDDSLGSTVGLLNGTSTSLVRTYTYDPDGNATGAGTGPTTDLKFAGGHALSNGLYHFGARYYNPANGRWTQPDPLNQISSLTEANRYAYVGGDPMNYVDLTGRGIGDSLGDFYKNTVEDAITEVGDWAADKVDDAKGGCAGGVAGGVAGQGLASRFAGKAFRINGYGLAAGCAVGATKAVL